MGIGQGIPLQTVAYDCSNHLTNVRFEYDYLVSLDVSLIVLISSNSVMLQAVHVIPRGSDEAKINMTWPLLSTVFQVCWRKCSL